jgi:hypothetical protein
LIYKISTIHSLYLYLYYFYNTTYTHMYTYVYIHTFFCMFKHMHAYINTHITLFCHVVFFLLLSLLLSMTILYTMIIVNSHLLHHFIPGSMIQELHIWFDLIFTLFWTDDDIWWLIRFDLIDIKSSFDHFSIWFWFYCLFVWVNEVTDPLCGYVTYIRSNVTLNPHPFFCL